MRAATLSIALCTFAFSAHAVEKQDLPLFTAKLAAEIKAAIPGSQAEVQGTIAIVKKNTVPGPKSQSASATGKNPEVPGANGVIVGVRVERYWAKQRPSGGAAVQGAWVAKTPVFDPARAKSSTGSCHTSAVQPFEKSNVVVLVDIWFGQSMDRATLERAYGALTQFTKSELQ